MSKNFTYFYLKTIIKKIEKKKRLIKQPGNVLVNTSESLVYHKNRQKNIRISLTKRLLTRFKFQNDSLLFNKLFLTMMSKGNKTKSLGLIFTLLNRLYNLDSQKRVFRSSIFYILRFLRRRFFPKKIYKKKNIRGYQFFKFHILCLSNYLKNLKKNQTNFKLLSEDLYNFYNKRQISFKLQKQFLYSSKLVRLKKKKKIKKK